MNADQHFICHRDFSHSTVGISHHLDFFHFLRSFCLVGGLWFCCYVTHCQSIALIWHEFSNSTKFSLVNISLRIRYIYLPMNCVQIHTPYEFWIFITINIYSFFVFRTLFISGFIAFLMPCFGHVLFILYSLFFYLTCRWIRRSVWLKSEV